MEKLRGEGKRQEGDVDSREAERTVMGRSVD